MKNSIAKIKKFAKNHTEEIIIGTVAGAAAGGAYVLGIVVHKHLILKDAIIIPAAIVNHMKTTGEGILGVDVIPGYDVLTKLIPIVKS